MQALKASKSEWWRQQSGQGYLVLVVEVVDQNGGANNQTFVDGREIGLKTHAKRVCVTGQAGILEKAESFADHSDLKRNNHGYNMI